LQRLRLRLGLTQPQMARRVGRSLRAYTAYERGETRAVDPAVLMLAETWALGVPEPKGGDDA
jgi:transcriptional regulator with XRE-family HTH domain